MDAKKVLIEQFDKIALGFSGAILLGFLATSFFGGSVADAKSTEVAESNQRIKDKMEQADLAHDRLRRSEEAPQFDETVKRALAGGPYPSQMAEWLFHRRPRVITKVIGIEIPDLEHLPPVDVAGSPGLGQISISWAENPSNQLVVVESYTIFRKDAQGGEWGDVAQLDGSVHAWKDTTAEPRGEYWYLVESHGIENKAHPVVKRHDLKLAEDKKVRRSIEVGPFRTKRDIYLELTQVIPKPSRDERIRGEPDNQRAWIKVYKYFTDEGAWQVSPQYTLTPGQDVGKVEKIGGKEVDFTTPYVLVETDRRDLEKQIPGEGGGSFTVKDQMAKIKDKKTGEVFEIYIKTKDPGLESVLQEMKGGGDSGDLDDKGGDKPR